MSVFTIVDTGKLIGREVEGLNFVERSALAGKWIALEIYTPKTIPLKRIVAVGDSVADCARQLNARGPDPARFEFSRVNPLF